MSLRIKLYYDSNLASMDGRTLIEQENSPLRYEGLSVIQYGEFWILQDMGKGKVYCGNDTWTEENYQLPSVPIIETMEKAPLIDRWTAIMVYAANDHTGPGSMFDKITENPKKGITDAMKWLRVNRKISFNINQHLAEVVGMVSTEDFPEMFTMEERICFRNSYDDQYLTLTAN